eukprot:m.154567 g.154567  ORF g.154567 m.154567 type:complete len:122 (-) comp14300_c0_seq12:184-549(-)
MSPLSYQPNHSPNLLAQQSFWSIKGMQNLVLFQNYQNGFASTFQPHMRALDRSVETLLASSRRRSLLDFLMIVHANLHTFAVALRFFSPRAHAHTHMCTDLACHFQHRFRLTFSLHLFIAL